MFYIACLKYDIREAFFFYRVKFNAVFDRTLKKYWTVGI